MAKIKKFQLLRVPIEIEYQKPIKGRLVAAYAWIKCIKLIKYSMYYTISGLPGRATEKGNYYMLAIPKFEVINNGNA